MTRARGFSLLELLVVISIMAMATAGVAMALRDSGQSRLEREGQRLAALLEAGRAQARASGTLVRWQAQGAGFRFEGLPPGSTLPTQWLDPGTRVADGAVLILGPEPLLPPQRTLLTHIDTPELRLSIASDGLRPFAPEGQP
ncbi:prepilin-type N-terminal cleavage/methylation domain-containing protein [Pantoea sp. 18069]|uniref:prepilin-type N-terminal cleavage/methylation domain-containing protein n=1 Tax=Pantoea sp. 18069 TaxID=2681415 RepID=UPI00135859B9|nr:prepilin-type N-terminal cleavage/methylation domain-containing protein [Pantoea sp. 18069]